MIMVKATREGLEGHVTSSGYIIDKNVPFVALPSYNALFKFVRLHNPLTGLKCCAVVLDVGPFNTDDDGYVFGMMGQRPKAELGISISGKGTNGAGIDLSDKVWHQLGMLDNTEVNWEFI